MIKIKSVLGPNPYVGGTGVQCVFGDCEKILSLIVVPDNTDLLNPVDNAYAIRASFSAVPSLPTATALIAALSTVAPGAWGELAGGNFAGRRFTFIADCE